MRYYEVAPTKIVRATSSVFTYHTDTPTELNVGQLVTIPVGKHELTGLVVRAVPRPHYNTRQITSLLNCPPLPAPLVATALWMASYYDTHLATVLQTILPRGITKKRRAIHKLTTVISRERTNFLFNSAQLTAIDQLSSMSSGSAVLHGITGSGKTAVYIELTKRALADGKSVIVLVPEIALTSQLVAEFQQHFERVILTHSKQTEAERHLSWQDALTSETPRVAIGPRSALFTPFSSVGYIIIDEAHEPSFKQDQSPRYSALRVASFLAKAHDARAIQGSATPLVSEYFYAQSAGRPIVRLPQKARPDTVDPLVTVVPMTEKNVFSRHRFFSTTLLDEIATTIANGHQALIFHNRRGSASTTLCEHCGWSATCSRCFVPYTLHGDSHQLICHICGANERVPTSCPECHHTDIVHKGIGTKLIESELRRLFPAASIARFDGDTSSDQTVERRYQELYDGTIDIIVGTQVIAKGLDLPHLRTVGVIQADAGLALPDYIAAERTFQLLAQVVGRVGRNSHATRVIVQSYNPDSPPVAFGIQQNYAAFYEYTLHERQKGHFPPFAHLLKLTCVYKTEAAAIRNARALAATLRRDFPDVIILGPTPAFYERQHDTYRWQLVIQSPSRSRLLDIAAIIPPLHWQVDIDPASLL